MILTLDLEHVKTLKKTSYDIWNVPADIVSRLASENQKRFIVTKSGDTKTIKAALESFISKIILEHLPASMHNFRVLDWQISDQRMFKGKNGNGETAVSTGKVSQGSQQAAVRAGTYSPSGKSQSSSGRYPGKQTNAKAASVRDQDSQSLPTQSHRWHRGCLVRTS